MKKCGKCKIEKNFDEFYKDKYTSDGLCCNCKNCRKKYSEENKDKIKQYRKEYNKENEDRIKKQKKEYKKINREKIKQQNKQYCKENRLKINQQKKEYQRNRRKNDPVFRLASNLRRSFHKGIINHGGVKSASAQELLGCTWEEARIYIENQFLEGMNWENYPDWEIDHIRPMASFDLTDTEQQRQCFHYTNLRPMWAEENWSKSSFWNDVKHYYKKTPE